MADSGKSGSPALNLNSLLALLTLAGSALLISNKLTSDRPVAPAGASAEFVGEQSLEARLWEDPFKRGDKTSGEPSVNFRTLLEQIARRNTSSGVLMLPIMLAGGQYSEDQESRIRSRYAIVSALGRSGYAPADAEHLGLLRVRWPTERELELAKRQTSTSFENLWEQRESQRNKATTQTSETIVTIRITNGVPDETKFSIAHPTTQTDPGERLVDPKFVLGIPTSFEMDVHFEWYSPRAFVPGTKPRPNVLVVWLDDSFFENEPLLRLALFLEPLIKTNNFINVSLIGPRRSSTLRAMLPQISKIKAPFWELNNETWQLAAEVLKRVEVFCATPSAMDEVLVNTNNPVPRGAVGRTLVANGFKDFHNFSVTDAQLADEILDELKLRRINLAYPSNHLVLISESDTFYARMLTLTYGAQMSVRQGRSSSILDFIHSLQSGERGFPPNFHSMAYLRGLDGQTLRSGPAGATKDSAPKAPTLSFDELKKWLPDANKSEGPAQFDYLSRRGDELEALEEYLTQSNGRVKIVVGIVGSDVYDTLLILQALRPRFPNFQFFTTDLDARFWHPREKPWSRNLIVASGYGLALHPDLQKEVAPFRESLQTAQFAAALAALGNTQLAQLTTIPPRIFEIGNHAAVDLSTKPGLLLASNVIADTSDGPWLHPLTLREQYTTQKDARSATLSWSLWGLGFVCLLLCGFWTPLRERTFGVFQFPFTGQRYRRCDIGGPNGVETLLDWITDNPNSPTSKWLTVELQKTGQIVLPLSKDSPPQQTVDTIKPVHTATDQYSELLLQKTNQAALDKTKRDKEKAEALRHSQQASAFVRVLNGILNKELIIPDDVRREIAPHLRRRMDGLERRRFIDALLDKLSAKMEDKTRLPAASARAAAQRLFNLRLGNLFGFWIAAGILVLIFQPLGRDIWTDTFVNPHGEPFSLSNGISAWPGVILKLLAPLFTVFFCVILYSHLRVLFYDLTRRYRFQLEERPPRKRAWDRSCQMWSKYRDRNFISRIYGGLAALIHFIRSLISDYCGPFQRKGLAHSDASCVTHLWGHYRDGGYWIGRFSRAGLAAAAYFCLGYIIFQLFGAGFQPLRGDTIYDWSRYKISASWFKPHWIYNGTFYLLTFLTIDAARLCRRFIQSISAGKIEFPYATREHFRRQRGNISAEYLDEWIGTNLVADITERVGKLLWFPAIILLLMLVARNELWDHWPWNPALVIMMTLNFVIALASVVVLQRAARTAKNAAEVRLTSKLKTLRAQVAPSSAQNDADQAEKLLDEIKSIRRGAFVSIWDNPVIGALLIGPGGLTLLQMAIWLMQR